MCEVSCLNVVKVLLSLSPLTRRVRRILWWTAGAERGRFCFERRGRHRFCVSRALCLTFLGTLFDLGSIRLCLQVRVQRVYMGNFILFGFDVVVLLCLDLRCLIKVVLAQHPRHNYVVLDKLLGPLFVGRHVGSSSSERSCRKGLNLRFSAMSLSVSPTLEQLAPLTRIEDVRNHAGAASTLWNLSRRGSVLVRRRWAGAPHLPF